MKDKMTEQQDKLPAEDPVVNPAIPLAATESNVGLRLGKFSNLWWLTVLSLLAAIVLVWWSLPKPGLRIKVKFPEGHGLKAEDQVLFRGIEVGLVEDVVLAKDLTGIDVAIQLKESAAALAREGTQFWIVRPKLSITEISGLETAVGHKYVSLEPGPEGGQLVQQFDGLANAPVLNGNEVGIEIVIRGDRRRSVSAGSPVTFRGVEVGRVMSVGLSPDSRYVDVRARVYERYRDYLTTSSRFWTSAGVDVDFSLGKGLSVDTESLTTLAQGGISFLTIDNSGKSVSSGHVFRLYEKAADEWFSEANQVAATNIELGGVTTIVKSWRQKGLLGKRSKELTFNGVPCADQNDKKFLIVPDEAMAIPAKAIDSKAEFILLTRSSAKRLEPDEVGVRSIEDVAGLGILPFENAPNLDWLEFPADFREPETTEDVFAVRATIENQRLTYLHYFIDKNYLRDDWTLSAFDGDEQLWHGSPVLSAADGKVIGILLVERREARVVPFDVEKFE